MGVVRAADPAPAAIAANQQDGLSVPVEDAPAERLPLEHLFAHDRVERAAPGPAIGGHRHGRAAQELGIKDHLWHAVAGQVETRLSVRADLGELYVKQRGTWGMSVKSTPNMSIAD